MDRVDNKRLDELLCAALDGTPAERRALLRQANAEHPDLGRRLQRMLTAAESAGDDLDAWLEHSRNELFEALESAAEDLSGHRIGPWQLQEPLARGGLATVYLADRADGAFNQRAAFKVLRRGLDTDDVVARFRAERQILSTLKHPGIAQILDGGALPDGRPFLVLEFVDGLPIIEYCRAHGLDLAARLRLVLQVLGALQHAHRYLVVHRDIKPSNVLVSAEGKVSLLDFGIAKLLDPTLVASDALQTRTGATLLTPAYASPEQHRGEAVTTASDLYQAGGLLFELLTGQQPPRAAGRSAHEPSLLASRAAGDAIPARVLRGDLDAIIARAMNVDAAMRYSSAGAMAADLQACLDGRPVSARPDTVGYRLRKLAGRRPWLLPAIAAGLMLTLAYIVTLTGYNRQIRLEQQRALTAVQFMVDLLGSPNPYLPADPQRGRHITVVEALDIGVARLRSGAYSDDRMLRASLLESISRVYENVDEHVKAIDLRQELLTLQQELFGTDSEPVVQTQRALAAQYRTIGDYQTAGVYYQQQLDSARRLYRRGDPRVGIAEAATARYLFRQGEVESSRQLYLQALAKLGPARETHAAEWINAVVNLTRVRGETDAADSLAQLREAMHFAEQRFGPEAPLAALTRLQYGVVLSLSGQPEPAEEYIDLAIRQYEAQLGRDHGATLIALWQLSRHQARNGRLATAESLQRETLGHYLRKYGPQHRGVAELSLDLADTLVRLERHSEAIPLFEQSYAAFVALLGPHSPLSQQPLAARDRAQAALAEVAD